ncbi:MAG: universal stress protein [Candidatus Tectomicrobia bacterium]|nr:universal stress protein [Candidatus Tectomicrobia bacterium]
MFKRILVALDGSPLAEQILPHVKELAVQSKATIFLLRVALAHTFPGVDPTEHQVKVVAEAEEYIERLRQQMAGEGLKVQAAVRYGHDAEEILDHSEMNEIDLVAMSTHGRSGVRRWVLGSVAEKVLRHSKVPILLFRAA